nr:hypothetical protein [Tanacetum cinerariifolium]
MTSITAQQNKLDLELVPKKNRLDIGKCNERIPRELKPKEETFQVVLDALALAPCYSAFIITADVPEVYMHQELGHTRIINSLNDVVTDQMHQPWRTFSALINRSLSGKTTALDKLRLSQAHILWVMYYQMNVDYVELLWEHFTYQIDNRSYKKQEKMYYPRFTKVIIHRFLIQEKTLSWRKKNRMHTSKDDYLINTLRFVSRKEASLKYGAVLPKCLTSPQMKESKAYKIHLGYATCTVPPKVTKKFKKASPSKKDSVPVPADEEPVHKGKRVKISTKKYLTTPTTGIVIRKPHVETQSKRKEKVDVARGKGIDLLYEVALTKEAQIKEVKKKSLRDFQKSHPSGSGSVAEKLPSVEKITPPVTSEGTGDKPGENYSEDHESNSEQDTDGTESDSESDQQDDDDEVKDDNDDDDKDDNDDDDKDDNENDDNGDDKSEGDEYRGMDSDDIQEKKILPKEVSNFALPVIEKMIQESLNQVNLANASSQPQSTYEAATKLTEFDLKKILIDKMNSSKSYLTAPKHQECYDGLVKSYNLEKDFFSSYDVYSLKGSRDDKDKDEGPSAGSNRRFKQRKTSKDAKPTTSPKTKDSSSKSSKGTKSQQKSSGKSVHAEEPEFEVGDTDMPQGPSFRLLKGTRSNYAELEYDFEECYKALLEKLDWENPEGGDYPFDLSKPLPLITRENCRSGDYPFDLSKPRHLITRGNHQSVPVEFFFNNDLKYLQGGISTMTYTTSTTKIKTAQYDLPDIKDMVPNNESPVKVAYDKYALWGISHWRDQRKIFYAYVRGIQSRGDVYSTKRILAVTHVSVIRKHRYGYLEEIVVRRADNALYKFKEGNDNEVDPIDNEMESFLASKLIGVGFGPKRLLKQCRENNMDGDYDPYDDDMYEGEGHMARQCTQPKRPRNAAWYKEKAMLTEAHKAGQILDEEQLAFLADPGIPAGQAQIIIPHNASFQTEDLDTYDSNCDELSNAQAVLMANISNYGSDVISEGLARGILRLKFQRDHLRSACALGKSKKPSHQPKAEDTNQEKLYLLHMDLCGPMRVASINGKRTQASCYGSYYTQYMTRFKPCIPPNKDDWDHLFQPMFDEYFNPQTIAVSSVQEATAPRAEVLADSPVSISITQDALSTSIPSSQEQEHSPIIFQGFEESSKTPTFHDDPLNESLQDSTSQGLSYNVIQIQTPFEHLEPKNFKQVMMEPSWIDAIQKEIHEFERLEV